MLDAQGQNVFVGSSAGEVCIFNVPNKIFKAAISVSTNWVLSMALLPQGDLVVGSGDGKLKRLHCTNGTDYVIRQEVQLDGAVTSINQVSSVGELVVATNQAKVYRTNQDSLQSSVYCEGGIGNMKDVAISAKNELYAVASTFVFVYDFSELQLVTTCRTPAPNTSLCFAEDLS